MQVSQSALFRLCCASFLAGVLLALFYDSLYMTRLWLLSPNNRYTVPAIQERYASRIKNKKIPKKEVGFRVALFVGDVFFCLVGALAIILLLYWLNNGAFRAAAPLCMALGFALWRISFSRGIRIVFQWGAFIIETVIYVLLLPIKRLLSTIVEACRRNAKKRRYRRLARKRQTYTKQILQNIDRAAERLLPIDTQTRMLKGEGRAKQRKKAI